MQTNGNADCQLTGPQTKTLQTYPTAPLAKYLLVRPPSDPPTNISLGC